VVEEVEGAHLLAAEETTASKADSEPAEKALEDMNLDPDSVFAKLKNLKSEDL